MVKNSGESGCNARVLLELANGTDEFIYCKHDGSLERGFEIVTHPMTYSFHRERMPWQVILSRAAAMGCVSHQSGTCGLHVHINRDSFGPTTAEQEACIARIRPYPSDHSGQCQAKL